MRRFVRSDLGVYLVLGSIGGLIVGLTHAGKGVAYLIAFALLAIATGITEGSDLVRLWRKRLSSVSRRRP
jgi:hypothetical protein